MLDELRKRFQVSTVVVLEGLKPASLAGNNDITPLKKSHAIWTEVQQMKGKSNLNVHRAILREYGSRFYQQEIINATNAVADCSFFIAPFLASPQIAQFYKDELVNAAFGSSKLLCYECFDQAIVDFDSTAGTFTFIDREDLHLGNDKLAPLVDYFVYSGSVYGQKVLEQRVDKAVLIKSLNTKQPLPPLNASQKELELSLKKVFVEQRAILAKDLTLKSLKAPDSLTNVSKVYGKSIQHMLTCYSIQASASMTKSTTAWHKAFLIQECSSRFRTETYSMKSCSPPPT